MKVLVSGFRPFLGEKINPSQLLAEKLGRSNPDVESVILPVEFGRGFDILKACIDSSRPNCLIMIGQASGRKNICLEKVGLNWVHTIDKDESGLQPKTGSILPHEPLALMSQFLIEEKYLMLKSKDHPVEISFSAGAFVCNELYFRCLQTFPGLPSLFVHVPLIPEQVSAGNPRPFIEFETQFAALSDLVKMSLQP